MENIKIIHLSDLHLSSKLTDEYEGIAIPKYTGHDPKILKELIRHLKTIEYDVLIISGDCSKTGEDGSFINIKNIFEDDILKNVSKNKKNEIPFIVVPGNHDFYLDTEVGIQLPIQTNKKNFVKNFGEIKNEKHHRFEINGTILNLYAYDSNKIGTFANGELKVNFDIPRMLDNEEINIAVLHHPFIIPPNAKYKKSLEIDKAHKVAEFFVASNFDVILSGHLHKQFVDCIPIKHVRKLIPVKGKSRVLRNLAYSAFYSGEIRPINTRERLKNGHYPSYMRYLEFLFYKLNYENEIQDINQFKSVHEFYNYLDSLKGIYGTAVAIEKLIGSTVIFSMAPSACQYKEKKCGFNEIHISSNNKEISIKEFQYVNGIFECTNTHKY